MFITRPSTDSVRTTTRASEADQPLKLRSVLDGTFRANPDYELVPFGGLPIEQQELFSALKGDPDFFGILRPRDDSQLALKSACKDTALLFVALQDAGKLPSFVTAAPGPNTNQDVVEL